MPGGARPGEGEAAPSLHPTAGVGGACGPSRAEPGRAEHLGALYLTCEGAARGLGTGGEEEEDLSCLLRCVYVYIFFRDPPASARNA